MGAAVVNLVGVLPDGSAPRAGVDAEPRQLLTITKGVDLNLRVSVMTPTGAPVRISNADTIVMTVKRRPTDPVAAFSKTGSVASGDDPATVTFQIALNDVRLLDFGRYVWDVWLTQGAKRSPVVPLSVMVLEPSAG